MLYRVEGIVIRSTDYGEGGKIVTLLTPTHGKQAFVARGAAKPKSRYGALALPFTYGEYVYYKSGAASLGTLNGAEAIESYRALREGLDLPAYAAYAAELSDRAIEGDEAGAALFHQLKACLAALADGKDPQVVLRLYEMKVAALAGYAPVLDECVSCGRPWENGAGGGGLAHGSWKFSPAAGGALCPRCAARDPAALALDEPVWKLLRLFAALDMRRLGSIAVRDEYKRQLQMALRRWIDTHLGLTLKSRAFLDKLDRFAGMSDGG